MELHRQEMERTGLELVKSNKDLIGEKNRNLLKAPISLIWLQPKSREIMTTTIKLTVWGRGPTITQTLEKYMNLLNSSRRKIPTIYKWRIQHRESLSDLSKVTQLVSARTMIFILSAALSLFFCHYLSESYLRILGFHLQGSWHGHEQTLATQPESLTFTLKAKMFACFGFQTTKWISRSFLCRNYLCI